MDLKLTGGHWEYYFTSASTTRYGQSVRAEDEVLIQTQRPFEGNHHEQLAQTIMRGEPNYPVTNPPVSMVCMHAISSLLEKDKSMRIGASSWESFVDNPFFRELDFIALERKEVEPIFRPSSEKTNFDATYDLEELLLEEAPLEARTRKQKPRAELRADASDAEIRADELHRMIETMFEPFNYTTLPEHRCVTRSGQQSYYRANKKQKTSDRGVIERRIYHNRKRQRRQSSG